MKSQNNHHTNPSNFWFGFGVGAIGAVAAAYLLGTKNGRETLRKLVAYADKLEEGSDEFLDLMDSLKHVVKEKSSEVADAIEGASAASRQHKPLDVLIDKVRSITHENARKEIFVKK